MADEPTPDNPQGEQTPAANPGGGTTRVEFSGNPEERAQQEGDQNNQQEEPAQRPEGLPEGFDNWEAFGKAVAAGTHHPDGSEKKAAEEEEESTPEALTSEQQADVDAALADVPEESREKAQPFFEEFARTGELSEASVKEAAKAFGVSEDMVKQYVAGYQVNDQAAATAVFAEAGITAEEAAAFKTWAEEGGMSPEQMQAFNAKPQAQAYKEGIAAWKEAGNGPAPRDITAGERNTPPANSASPEPYASTTEMTRDMNNPLYASDPAFRAKVEKRVEVSNFN